MKPFGVVLSAGGSAFFKALALAEIDAHRVVLVTDRACGAYHTARRMGLDTRLIPFKTHEQFSLDASRHFGSANAAAVLLNYSRLVRASLFDAIPTFNVHPSLLPSFPGMGAVRKSYEAGSDFQGASLHWVDAGIDTGRLVAQTVYTVRAGWSLARLETLSYVQKTTLNALWMERWEEMIDDSIESGVVSPGEPASGWLKPCYRQGRLKDRITALYQASGFPLNTASNTFA